MSIAFPLQQVNLWYAQCVVSSTFAFWPKHAKFQLCVITPNSCDVQSQLQQI